MREQSRWNPLIQAVSLRHLMDRLLEDSFAGPGDRGDSGRTLRPPLDVYTTDEDIVVIMPLPGVKPEDVDVTIEGDIVTIRGEIKPDVENVDYLVQERLSGPFRRVLTLNVPVQPEKAGASFQDGLLTLTLPKADALRPRSIKVQASK